MTLKAIHLVDEGAYLIEAGWGLKLEVDGIPAPQSFVVSSLDSIVCVETTMGKVIAREDAEGNQINEVDFQIADLALRVGCKEDEDLNPVFPNLDAEYEWRKFRARWSKVVRSPDVVSRSPIEATVTEVRVRSGDPDINSLWNSPNTHHDQKLYSMSRDAVIGKTVRELCAEAGLRLDIPSHSGIRFAQIEGGYAFNDSFSESPRPFIGTLEQCKAEKATCIRRVADVVGVHAAKKRGIAVPNIGDTVIALRAVQRSLMGVRAKQDTSGTLRSAMTALVTVINGLEAEVQKETA